MQTLKEAIWCTCREADTCRAIIQKHDALASADDEISAWHAGLHARFNELLATAKGSGKVADAEKALVAFQRTVGGDIVRKTVSEGYSERTYRYISDPEHRKPFEQLAKRLRKAISALPPTRSKAEARDRRALFRTLEQFIERMANPSTTLLDSGFMTSLVRTYGTMPAAPQPAPQAVTDPDLAAEPIAAPSLGGDDKVPASLAGIVSYARA